ncbi:Polysaccharide biosynthesis protein [Paraburkholderia ribeironis]|uniref:Polysaccharide biosynthesis protein n=1 Tax=Paraburkholderia ribeironis TaxID=1247936 RepID=A0A1N7S6B3_9BURK|nr:flippase [Paraburkholderia ribeironis]SIT42908.1 Polysaccharide biosynthesis protein [Paraburkholderia ribeironis]
MTTRKVIASLYSVQLLNYAVPVVVLPYLSRVLGPAGFGVVGYAQTVAQILLIFVDFGFDLTSARKVALHSDQPEVLNKIYWTTMSAKSLLAMICCMGLAALAFLGPDSGTNRVAMLLGMLIIWGSVLTPTWFYQGIQRMPMLALSMLLVRGVLLIPLFIFVRTAADVAVAAALQFSPAVVAGLVLTAWLFRTRRVSFGCTVKLRDVLRDMKDAYHIFVSSALTSVYMYANVVFLRAIAGNADVGYYVAAEKLTTPLRQLSVPLIQSFFPKMCQLYANGDVHAVGRVLRRIVAVFTIAGALLFVGFQVLGKWFVTRFFGDGFTKTYHILQVMILVPAIICVAAAVVQLCIVASGNQNVLKRIYVVGALFHLCQMPLAIYFWGSVGAAYSVAATELFMSVIACFKAAKINAQLLASGQSKDLAETLRRAQ